MPAYADPPPSPALGRYCAHDALEGATGRGTIPLGDFNMVVDVALKDGIVRVSFFNAMPDSERVLEVDSAPAQLGSDRTLRFSFIDGWDNRGSGKLTPSGLFSLEVDRQAPEGGDIIRNYVTNYPVTKTACTQQDLAIRFSH